MSDPLPIDVSRTDMRIGTELGATAITGIRPGYAALRLPVMLPAGWARSTASSPE
jgi:hypothetical protein